jgi:hypothetical protein
LLTYKLASFLLQNITFSFLIFSRFYLIADKKVGVEEVKFPEHNLFVWALLLNRIEIAKIFWQIGEVTYNKYTYIIF